MDVAATYRLKEMDPIPPEPDALENEGLWYGRILPDRM
jgi:hypothetical protein